MRSPRRRTAAVYFIIYPKYTERLLNDATVHGLQVKLRADALAGAAPFTICEVAHNPPWHHAQYGERSHVRAVESSRRHLV